MYIKIKLTDVGLGKLYSTQGGRMRVLSKSLAKASEPRKWSAWFPNLPTKAKGVTIYRKSYDKFNQLPGTILSRKIKICRKFLI